MLAPDEIPNPVHLNVTPGVVEPAEIMTLEFIQFKLAGVPVVRFGIVMFEVTLTVPVFVHPPASVIVTVYVLGVLTVGVEVFPPETIPEPDQLYVTPGVVEDAEIVVVPDPQPKTLSDPIVKFGIVPAGDNV